MSTDSEWLSAAEALSLVETAMSNYDAIVAITTRAYDGLIQTRAERFVINSDEAKIDAELPKQFWWACGEAALEQNWVSGDFSTWIKQSHWRAYDVHFRRSEIEKLISKARPKPPNKPELWLSLREAVLVVSKATRRGHLDVLTAIISLGQSEQIKGRAADIREVIHGYYDKQEKIHQDKTIPLWFWKECTKNANYAQQWELGILKGLRYIDGKKSVGTVTGVELEAFGLTVLAPDLKPQFEAATNPSAITQVDGVTADNSSQGKGGRPLSKLWPNWVAELVLYYHEKGIPPGEGQQGQEELIKAIGDRLMERGLEAPSRTTVQPVVQAVLARLRSAGN